MKYRFVLTGFVFKPYSAGVQSIPHFFDSKVQLEYV